MIEIFIYSSWWFHYPYEVEHYIRFDEASEAGKFSHVSYPTSVAAEMQLLDLTTENKAYFPILLCFPYESFFPTFSSIKGMEQTRTYWVVAQYSNE